MTQLTLTQVRTALAAYLTTATGLRTLTTRLGTINPPCAIILPEAGVFADYQVSMDGQVDYHLRAVIIASAADSASGQDILDTYLATTGTNSIWAAVRADPTLGGQVGGFAQVTQAAGYGVQNWNGVDYLAASVTVYIGE